jgi:hypothetical protein
MPKDTDASDAQADKLEKLRELDPGVHRQSNPVARDRLASPKSKLFAKKRKVRLVLRPISRNAPAGKNHI